MLRKLILQLFFLVTIVLCPSCATFFEQKAALTQLDDQKPSLLCRAIIDEHGKPTPALAQVLAITGVPYDGTREGLVKQTQQQWLRSLGKERWQVADSFADKREQLMPLFDKMGMVQALKPHYHHYDYALLLGANVPAMRSRLAYLVALWEDGIRFDQVVFLVGERPLDPVIENDAVLLNRNNDQPNVTPNWRLIGKKPVTEAQASRLVYDQVLKPEAFKQIPVAFVDTPMQRQGLVSRRPNTADTLVAWLATKPKLGLCLVISGQPVAAYQEAVASSILPASFTLDTVGSAAKDCGIAIYLDTLARVLFVQQQRG